MKGSPGSRKVTPALIFTANMKGCIEIRTLSGPNKNKQLWGEAIGRRKGDVGKFNLLQCYWQPGKSSGAREAVCSVVQKHLHFYGFDNDNKTLKRHFATGKMLLRWKDINLIFSFPFVSIVDKKKMFFAPMLITYNSPSAMCYSSRCVLEVRVVINSNTGSDIANNALG